LDYYMDQSDGSARVATKNPDQCVGLAGLSWMMSL
jgi:hypothetical protein